MIEITLGDICLMDVDAVVNAANSQLVGGGGVDGAIHRAGGPSIMEECDIIRAKQGGCPTGEAVITAAGNLLANYVIHTVGPIWNGGLSGEEELLSKAYESSMMLAHEHQINSIAFPNISTGIYGFPKDLAAAIAITTVQTFMSTHTSPKQVLFVCFDSENFQLYKNQMPK